jgi:hypothetical protein
MSWCGARHFRRVKQFAVSWIWREQPRRRRLL